MHTVWGYDQNNIMDLTLLIRSAGNLLHDQMTLVKQTWLYSISDVSFGKSYLLPIYKAQTYWGDFRNT